MFSNSTAITHAILIRYYNKPAAIEFNIAMNSITLRNIWVFGYHYKDVQ